MRIKYDLALLDAMQYLCLHMCESTLFVTMEQYSDKKSASILMFHRSSRIVQADVVELGKKRYSMSRAQLYLFFHFQQAFLSTLYFVFPTLVISTGVRRGKRRHQGKCVVWVIGLGDINSIVHALMQYKVIFGCMFRLGH